MSTTSLSDKPVRIKVHVSLALLDSMARAIVQNITMHNGTFGCSYCINPGKRLPGISGNKRHIYSDSIAQLRLKDFHSQWVREAVELRRPVKGVKRPTVVMLWSGFSVGEDMPGDYLYAALECVMKGLFIIWFDSSNHEQPWYIGRFQDQIDNMIKSIQPPVEIRRILRSTKYYKNWTAAEWKSFLLYYSIPLLKNVLPPIYSSSP